MRPHTNLPGDFAVYGATLGWVEHATGQGDWLTPLYPHILQNQANGGEVREDAGLGQAVSPGEGEVLAGHGDGAFRQGGDVGGAGQARMVMCSRVRSRRRALWFQSPP